MGARSGDGERVMGGGWNNRGMAPARIRSSHKFLFFFWFSSAFLLSEKLLEDMLHLLHLEAILLD